MNLFLTKEGRKPEKERKNGLQQYNMKRMQLNAYLRPHHSIKVSHFFLLQHIGCGIITIKV